MPKIHPQMRRLGKLNVTREMAVRYVECQGLRAQGLEQAPRIICGEEPELLRRPEEPVHDEGGEPNTD